MEHVALLLLGLGVGTLGTLIGAGGGFVLMPILLLAYPQRSPATLTAISLAVVCFNASSGSWSYARMKRVDVRSGVLFLLAGIPGAIAGACGVNHVPRQAFNIAFGLILLSVGLLIFVRTVGRQVRRHTMKATIQRDFIDAEGTRYVYGYNLGLGMALSFVVGAASSMLGIGGGIIHVPAMASLLGFPVHIATATSHFILAVMAGTATVVHLLDGSLGTGQAVQVLPLSAGAVVGAQAGARLSRRVHGRWILRALAFALALVGARILALAFMQHGQGASR